MYVCVCVCVHTHAVSMCTHDSLRTLITYMYMCMCVCVHTLVFLFGRPSESLHMRRGMHLSFGLPALRGRGGRMSESSVWAENMADRKRSARDVVGEQPAYGFGREGGAEQLRRPLANLAI